MSEELAFVKENRDTLSFAVWSAGAFDDTYNLSVSPLANGTDQELWTEAGQHPLNLVSILSLNACSQLFPTCLESRSPDLFFSFIPNRIRLYRLLPGYTDSVKLSSVAFSSSDILKL